MYTLPFSFEIACRKARSFQKDVDTSLHCYSLFILKYIHMYIYRTAQFKFYIRVRAQTHFARVKVYNLECIFLVARGFVMHTCAIKHLWHTNLVTSAR